MCHRTKKAMNTNKDLASSLKLKQNQMFLTTKQQVQSKYFKENELRSILQDLCDLDYNFKSGKIDLQVGMETILCRYCSQSLEKNLSLTVKDKGF